MSNADLDDGFVLSAPHYTAGVYVDAPDRSSTLSTVCAHLQASHEVQCSAAKVAVTPEFPRYSDFAYGFPAPIETVRIADFAQPLPAQHQLLEASFASPSVGRILVAFEGIPPESVGRASHPIRITISAELLDLAADMPLSPEEQDQADAEAAFLVENLHGLCDLLKPLYGAIVAEEPIPTPIDLVTGRLRSGDVFLSNHLLTADDELGQLLTKAYAKGYSAPWSSGRYYSNWAPMNPLGRSTESPFRRNRSVSSALERALRNAAPHLVVG